MISINTERVFFLFIFLENIDLPDTKSNKQYLRERESYWINEYNTLNEYNTRTSNFKLICINCDSKEVLYFNDAVEASLKLNLNKISIARVAKAWKDRLTGISNTQNNSVNGYIFINEEYYDPEYDYLKHLYTPPTKSESTLKRLEEKELKIKQRKEIVLQKKLDKAQESQKIKDQKESGEYIYSGSKPIRVYNDEVSYTFKSMSEAIKELNLVSSKVSKCLKYGNKHHDYKFEYI